MSLFQKNEDSYIGGSLFTVGMNNTLLIVGLGNVGKTYNKTRHNVGFECVDQLVAGIEEFPKWIEQKAFKCLLTNANLGTSRVVVIKPTTLMNLSGESVSLVANFYKVPPSQIVVVHDEIDINFGQIKAAFAGSSAGHNGIKSVIKYLGKDFNRVRVGIGPKHPAQIDSSDFVLGKFNKTEEAEMPALTKEVASLVTEYIYSNTFPVGTRKFLL